MRGTLRVELQDALALMATVVGAGFASGREVLCFFSNFGPWSWAGCVLAAMALTGLAALTATMAGRLNAYDLNTLCRRALGERAGQIAAILNGAMVTVTAGAMIAAMGELTALALPVHHAYAIGVAGSVLLSLLLGRKGLSAIAAIGVWLLPACLLMDALLLEAPSAARVMPQAPAGAWRALPMGCAYAAMNAALACGVLCEIGAKKNIRSVRRVSAIAGGLLLTLLLGANAVLRREAETLRDVALPMVMLSKSLGAAGYWLCIAALSLAVITTLVALVRTLERMLESALPERHRRYGWMISLLLPLVVGFTGFDTLVGEVYPMLGAACSMMFLMIVLRRGRGVEQ